MERRFIYSSGEAFQRFRMGITVGEIRLNIKNRCAIDKIHGAQMQKNTSMNTFHLA